MREKKVDGGGQVRLGRRPLTPPAETHGLDHLRLVIHVLHGFRGPVREFEPTPFVLMPSARPQYAVKRLATGIQLGLRLPRHATTVEILEAARDSSYIGGKFLNTIYNSAGPKSLYAMETGKNKTRSIMRKVVLSMR